MLSVIKVQPDTVCCTVDQERSFKRHDGLKLIVYRAEVVSEDHSNFISPGDRFIISENAFDMEALELNDIHYYFFAVSDILAIVE